LQFVINNFQPDLGKWREKMKTRILIKNDVVNGKKIELGRDVNHKVMETIEDCIELLRNGVVTIGDVNSGYSVRRQRELCGGQSKNDKFAKSQGYLSWAALCEDFDLPADATIGSLVALARQNKEENKEENEDEDEEEV